MCITHGHTTYECIQFIKGALESDSICACMHILYDRVYIIRYVFDNIYSIDIIYIYIYVCIYIYTYIYTRYMHRLYRVPYSFDGRMHIYI